MTPKCALQDDETLKSLAAAEGHHKIDKIGDLTITSESSVKSLVIQGNHLLEVPLNSALSVSLES